MPPSAHNKLKTADHEEIREQTAEIRNLRCPNLSYLLSAIRFLAVVLLLPAPRLWSQSNLPYTGLLPAPRFQEQARIERRVAVEPDDTVFVRNRFGNIQVSTWHKPELRVSALVITGGDTKGDAENCLRQMKLSVKRTRRGHDSESCPLRLLIEVTCPDEHAATQFQANLDLTIPKTSRIDIENSYGDVLVEATEAPVVICNRFGNTHLSSTAQAEVVNAYGDVNVSRAGQRLSVRNQFGNVQISEAKGQVMVSNTNGELRVCRSCGELELDSRMGRVSVSESRGRFRISCTQSPVCFEPSATASLDGRAGADTVTIRSRNGMIQVMLPAAPDQKGESSATTQSEPSLQFVVRAVNGRIEIPFGRAPGFRNLDLPGPSSEGPDQLLNCVLGQGLELFDLETVNNNVVIDVKGDTMPNRVPIREEGIR